MSTPQVVKTVNGVDAGEWLDIVRRAPGEYDVQLAHSGQVIAEGFFLQSHAEEWLVELQAHQRGWVRVT